MSDAADAQRRQGVVEHSERFHRLIVEASGNRLLHTMWGSLSITDHTALTMVTLPLDLQHARRVPPADRRRDRRR